jgi:hypothetical protein
VRATRSVAASGGSGAGAVGQPGGAGNIEHLGDSSLESGAGVRKSSVCAVVLVGSGVMKLVVQVNCARVALMRVFRRESYQWRRSGGDRLTRGGNPGGTTACRASPVSRRWRRRDAGCARPPMVKILLSEPKCSRGRTTSPGCHLTPGARDRDTSFTSSAKPLHGDNRKRRVKARNGDLRVDERLISATRGSPKAGNG